MDEIRKWDPAEVLDGIDELLNTGVSPAADSYALADILYSYEEQAEAPEQVQAERAEETVEAPSAEEAPQPSGLTYQLEAMEEPELPKAEHTDFTEPELPDPETAEFAPTVEDTEEASEELPQESVEEAAEEEAYSLEAILQEFGGEPEEDKKLSLEDILKEYGEDTEEMPQPEEDTEEEGLDLSQMAFLIGQNVTDAMTADEDMEEYMDVESVEEEDDPTMDGLREFFEDARRRVADRMKRQKDGKKAPEAMESAEKGEAQPTQKITQMPANKMKAIRDSFGRIQDKMDDFADNMYADAVTEEEDLGEETVPGTDDEQRPKKEKEPSVSIREQLGSVAGFIRKKAPKAPDLSPEELARRYKLGLGFMRQRLFYLGVMTVIALAISVAVEMQVSLPEEMMNTRIISAVLTWLLGMSCATGLDVLWMGITAPFRGKPGMHTLTAAAVVATLADGIFTAAVGREGPLPFSALAMLSLFCAMLGAYWRKRTLFQSCRSVARSAETSRVTLDEDKWNGDAAFVRERGDTTGFGSQIQGTDGAQRIYRLWVPVIGVLAVLAAVAASVGHGRPGLLTWALSGIFVACAPLSGMMAFAQPYSKLARRLDHSGAVLAGWEGAESMTGKANILLTDEDLFPEGTVTQRSVAQAEGFPLEKLTACVASILYRAGSGLYHIFDSELRRQGGSYRRVDDIEFYEAGGFSADIRGEQVLVGSYAFLNVMKVEVPEGRRVRSSVFCVINKKVGGIFSLDYSMSHNDRQALVDLVRSGIHPVLVTRDFNIIPSMLQSRFDLPAEEMEYPRLERRRELSTPGQEHNPTLGAIVTRDNVAAYADAVIGGRRLSTIVKINAVIAVLASLVGLVLGFFLTWTAAFTSLTPLSMLLFLLIWAVPNIAVSGAADKF